MVELGFEVALTKEPILLIAMLFFPVATVCLSPNSVKYYFKMSIELPLFSFPQTLLAQGSRLLIGSFSPSLTTFNLWYIYLNTIRLIFWKHYFLLSLQKLSIVPCFLRFQIKILPFFQGLWITSPTPSLYLLSPTTAHHTLHSQQVILIDILDTQKSLSHLLAFAHFCLLLST